MSRAHGGFIGRISSVVMTLTILCVVLVYLAARPAATSASPRARPVSSDVPDVTGQVRLAGREVARFETTVNQWSLTCQMNSQVELELAYVRDALNQGNILGAQALLESWISDAKAQGRAGLLSAAEASRFRAGSSRILNSIPSVGRVRNEFHPSTRVPRPVPHPCPTGVSSKATPPPSTDPAATTSLPILDLDNLLRVVLQTAAVGVPHTGFVLSGLIELLWPVSRSNNVTWDQMREYVDQKINQAIDQQTKERLNAELTGLSRVLHNYDVALQDPSNPTFIRENFVSALNHLVSAAPGFAPATRPYLVLPEYTQIYNFLLAQLRDGIVTGPSFGIPPVAVEDYKRQIAADIQSATNHLNVQIAEAHKNVPRPTNNTNYNVLLFSANQNLDLALVPATSDQAFYWKYTDPVKYPEPVHPADPRVLYSPAYGYMPNNGTPSVNGNGKAQINHLTVWGYDRLDAIQVTYGSVTEPKMGGNGGTTTPPAGGSFALGSSAGSRGQITRVYGYAGDVQQALGFIFTKNGTATDSGKITYNKPNNLPYNYSLEFPDEVLGYVKIMGVFPSPYNSAASTIWGFRYADSYG